MTDRPGVYLALVHHPIRDRAGGTITTSVTNLDVHDLARTGRTYGLRGYFVVTPVEAQQALVTHIVGHWRAGEGGQRVPERAEAMRLVQTAPSLEAVCQELQRIEGAAPTVVTFTGALPSAAVMAATASARDGTSRTIESASARSGTRVEPPPSRQ